MWLEKKFSEFRNDNLKTRSTSEIADLHRWQQENTFFNQEVETPRTKKKSIFERITKLLTKGDPKEKEMKKRPPALDSIPENSFGRVSLREIIADKG
jgi:hypothetical protein